ncbi:MAG TPA: hypothetical protein VIY48_19200 [Candidatus Paceibacterota bacterium]
MASLNDLFGSSQEKRPKALQWNNVGDSHKVVIVSEPENVQQLQVNGNWEPQFLEKQADGKWKVKTQSELTEGRENSKLMQIILTVKLLGSDDLYTIFVDNKTKKEALKKTMEDTGLDIGPGNALMITRLPNVGRTWGWEYRLAAPKVKTEKA